MKVLLSFPHNQDTQGVTSNACFPPLGVLSIASFLKSKVSDIEIGIEDNDLSQGDAQYDVDIIGIYASFLSYKHALEIAENAKRNGSITVLGGPYPTVRWKEILSNQQFVDAVVVGEGEIPMLEIVQGKSFEDISGVAYRKNGYIVFNPPKELLPSQWPELDYSFVDFSSYWENWCKAFPEKAFGKPAPFYSQKGCPWRNSRSPCVFCSIPSHSLKIRSVESFWRHILKLVDDYGIDYVRDNSDDLLRNKRWLRRLNEVKPDRALPSLRFYARADSITEDIIPVLVSLNVVDVFIGFESGDNEILKRASKGTDVAVNMRAASLLAKAGIGVIGSFLLGLPGESKYTIQATIEHIKMLGEIAGIRRPGCAIVIPFPGTAMYDDLMCIPGMNEKYMGKDIINYDELRSDWLSRFTSVNYEYLIEVSDGLFNSDVIGSRMGFEDKVNRKLL